MSPHPKSLSANHSLVPPNLSAECQNVKDGDTPPAGQSTQTWAKRKTIRQAIHNLLETIKQPKKLLNKHWKGRSRLRSILPHQDKSGKQTSSSEEEEVSSIHIGPEGIQSTTSCPPNEVAAESSPLRGQPRDTDNSSPEPSPEPSPVTSSFSPTQDDMTQSGTGSSHGPMSSMLSPGTDHSILAALPPPPALFSDTRHSDSSISLSSQRDPSSVSPGTPGSQQSHMAISTVDRLFRIENRASTPFSTASTPFSTASTLQNSDYVHDDLSRRPSEVQPASSAEGAEQVGMAEGGPPSMPTPPTIMTMTTAEDAVPAIVRPPQSGRLHPIQTDFHPSHGQHGSDEEDSRSTIRDRSSSLASPEDRNAIGGAFG